ncbi:hypothetical protein KHA80_06195 [Anaerobacillus sp. HL2]|nr:hypothetical protein KHA80_06195 [Anaerobacillus sp. HL2]
MGFSYSKEKEVVQKCKFSKYFNASISIATLANEAFIIKNFENKETHVIVDNYKIEKNILEKL